MALAPPSGSTRPAKLSTLAVWGMVTAILVPLAGAVISHAALSNIKEYHLRGRGLALAGVFCGWILTVTVCAVMFWPFLLLLTWWGLI